MKPTLMVLAAGMGSRYGGLKQIDPVGPSGEAVLDYSVYDALRAGFGRVVFVIRKDIEEAFRDAIGKRYEGKVDVDYAFQELDALPEGYSLPEGRTKPWGTSHAILAGASVINEPFAAINADDFYGEGAFKVLADCLNDVKMDATPAQFAMVGYKLKNTLSEHGSVARGIVQSNANDQMVEIEEMLKISKTAEGAENTYDDGSVKAVDVESLVSMNFWGFTPQIFDYLNERFIEFLDERGTEMKSEYLIPTTVGEMVADDTCTLDVLQSNDSWFGVTYKEDKPLVVAKIRELVDAGRYPEQLWG